MTTELLKPESAASVGTSWQRATINKTSSAIKSVFKRVKEYQAQEDGDDANDGDFGACQHAASIPYGAKYSVSRAASMVKSAWLATTEEDSMTKISFIGAGSTVFAKNLMGDIWSYSELADATICLMDIDPKRLKQSEAVARHIIKVLGNDPKVEITTDRREALRDADYVITMIQVGGYEPATVIDFEIPKKYGLRQTIADTLGIGGIMRGLRTIPVLIDIARDMEALCPGALLINYANPMCMNQWALDRATDIASVGLCHSVPGTAHELARDIGMPADEINYLVAGINHMAFYLKFERRDTGEDLYPLLRRVYDENRFPPHNRVRYEMLRRLGYFVTESSEHFSEYVPWFIKASAPELIEEFNIPLDEYIERCKAGIISWQLLEKAEAEGRIPTREEILHALRDVNTDGVEWDRAQRHQLERGRPQRRIWLANHPQHGDGRGARDLWQCRQRWHHRQFACWLLRGGRLPGGWQRHPAHPRRRHSAPSGRLDANQYQCAVADRRSGPDWQTRAYLPRRHARPAYRRRIDAGSDLGDGR